MKSEQINPETQDDAHEFRKLKEQEEQREKISQDDFRFVSAETFERNNLSVRKGYTNEQIK